MIFRRLLDVILWPGNRFCAEIGTSPREDSGMFRGFVNSIVWGIVAAVVLWQVI